MEASYSMMIRGLALAAAFTCACAPHGKPVNGPPTADGPSCDPGTPVLCAKQCEEGQLKACVVLDRMAESTKERREPAAKQLDEACKKKSGAACYWLAELTEVKQNEEPKAKVALLEQACTLGSAEACEALYRHRRWQAKDTIYAVEWARRRTHQGFVKRCRRDDARACLGAARTPAFVMTSFRKPDGDTYGYGGEEEEKKEKKKTDPNLPKEDFNDERKEYCTKGDGDRPCDRVRDREKQREAAYYFHRALLLLRKGCERDWPWACVELGLRFEEGVTLYLQTGAEWPPERYHEEEMAEEVDDDEKVRLVGKDPQRAARRFEQACELKWPEGCGRLGRTLLEGKGNDRGQKLLERACTAGHAASCRWLAHRHRKVGKNADAARKYYRLGCEAGDAQCCQRQLSDKKEHDQ